MLFDDDILLRLPDFERFGLQSFVITKAKGWRLFVPHIMKLHALQPLRSETACELLFEGKTSAQQGLRFQLCQPVTWFFISGRLPFGSTDGLIAQNDGGSVERRNSL
ncbi:MAG: hypothetical protein HWE23_00095 [Rhodobacteraceae bacterium]|nr:hypothetical protein [Paracoccaceae bacterium]